MSARRFALFPAAVVAAAALLAASSAAEPPNAPAPVVAPAATPAVAIVDVEVSPEPVRAGRPVSIMIRTSPTAVTVTGRAFAHNFTIPKTGEGVFSGSGSVPWWARFFHGSVNVTFTASDGNGAEAQMEHVIRM